MKKLLLLDGMILAYAAWVAVFAVFFRHHVEGAAAIVSFHLLLLAVILLIPRRGAAWERSPAGEPRWRRHVRGGLRFFRYTYPMLLVLPFFEEVQSTVNAVHPDAPHWFERYLYSADRALFGELPAILLNPYVGLVQDELMHGFYLSYYFILAGGIIIAWIGDEGPKPGRGFQTTLTATMAGFFLCFIWYPFLPARGPWENPELMAAMTPFQGHVFTPLIEAIIERGAVSGGCFPSSHVAGSWGVVLGLFGYHRQPAVILGFFTLGLSLACVYTRYHHGVDVPAGFLMGALSALVARAVCYPRGRRS
jgi:membrane-associated phospholipid phosphatase